MKRYTGNLVIELEDQNTGNVETVSETNMVTNAVNDILGVNPMGVMYKAGGQYDDSLTWNDALLPICPNMIGGILVPSRSRQTTFICRQRICQWLMLPMMSMLRQTQRGEA